MFNLNQMDKWVKPKDAVCFPPFVSFFSTKQGECVWKRSFDIVRDKIVHAEFSPPMKHK